jgi:hypothetical protein
MLSQRLGIGPVISVERPAFRGDPSRLVQHTIFRYCNRSRSQEPGSSLGKQLPFWQVRPRTHKVCVQASRLSRCPSSPCSFFTYIASSPVSETQTMPFHFDLCFHFLYSQPSARASSLFLHFLTFPPIHGLYYPVTSVTRS